MSSRSVEAIVLIQILDSLSTGYRCCGFFFSADDELDLV
jgi:hypothetical protein